MRTRTWFFGGALTLIAGVLAFALPGLSALAQEGPTELSHDLGSSGTVDSYSISPDNRLIAYCGRTSTGASGLWITPVDGSAPAAQVPGVTGCVPYGNWPAPDGTTVMLGNKDPYPSSTSIPILVETALPFASRPLFSLPNGYLWYRQIRWTSDGQWIFFSASPAQYGPWTVFVAPVSGAQPARRLTPELSAGYSGAWDFDITSDGGRLVTVSDEATAGTSELFARTLPADLLAGAISEPLRLNGPMATGGDVGFFGNGGTGVLLTFKFTPDQSHVLYFADQDTDGDRALYSTLLDGGGGPTRLSPVFGAGDDFDWIWSLVDEYAWYRVNNQTSYRASIYRAPIDGPASSAILMADNGANLGFWPITGGSQAMIFGGHYVNGNAESFLQIGPMGGQPAEFTPVILPSTQGVSDTSPDGNTLVYSGAGELQRLDLRAQVLAFVPLSGTGSYPLLSNQRAVFALNDQLLSRALYGTSDNLLLSGALSINRSTAAFRITSDDRWVTFLAPTSAGSLRYALYASSVGRPSPTSTPTSTSTPTPTSTSTSTPTPTPTRTGTPTAPLQPDQHLYLPALSRNR